MNDEELDLNAGLLKQKKIPFWTMMRRILPYVGREWVAFVLSSILLLGAIGLNVYLPLIEEAVVAGLSDVASHTFSEMMGYAIAFMVMAVVLNVSGYFSGMILAKSGQRIVYRLRMEVFNHVEGMSQNQFNQMPVGSLVTRVATYTTSIANMFTQTFVNFTVNILTVIGVFVVMIIKGWEMALVMGGFSLLIIAISVVFAKVIAKVFGRERGLISDLNTFLNESLSGMKIIQLFNRQMDKQEALQRRNEDVRKARLTVTLCYGTYRPLINLIYYCAIGVIFILGCRMGFGGSALLAFYLLLSKFFEPIGGLSEQLNELTRGMTGLERIFNLMDIAPEVVDKEDAHDIGDVYGEIEFKHVWFAYVGEEWVLKDVSFKIKAGETAAFVGATGAGKTTILGLLVRNFEPQKGEITIDGVNVKDIKIKSLRKATGQMLQDVFLFSGSVKDNITLFDDSFTFEQIEAAARYVNALPFIEELPNKFDEKIIERGENLSQGQRQLLSFARVVLHNPQILILDEATANIDTETESLIQDSLEKMSHIGTMFVVAHRLSTIQKADKIIVLSKGEVVEMGNHQELLKLRGAYYKLYRLQFED